MEWIDLAEDGHVPGTCKHGNKPSSSKRAGNFLTSWEPISFWRRSFAPWRKCVSNIPETCLFIVLASLHCLLQKGGVYDTDLSLFMTLIFAALLSLK